MIDNHAQRYFDAKPGLIEEKSSELGRLLTFMPSFENTKQLVGQHQLPPLGVAYKDFGSPADILEIVDSRTLLRFRERVLPHDAAATIWTGPAGEPFSEKAAPQNPDALMMDIHVYNSPSTRIMSRFAIADGVAKFEPIEVIGASLPSLIWQPVYWPIVECQPSRLQPRYLAVLESDNDINITFSVVDDLDRGPIARIAFRKPWQSDAADIRSYPVASTRKGIALIKEKFAKAKEAVANPTLEYEEEWTLGVHALDILNQIRTAPFWGDYAELRSRH